MEVVSTAVEEVEAMAVFPAMKRVDMVEAKNMEEAMATASTNIKAMATTMATSTKAMDSKAVAKEVQAMVETTGMVVAPKATKGEVGIAQDTKATQPTTTEKRRVMEAAVTTVDMVVQAKETAMKAIMEVVDMLR